MDDIFEFVYGPLADSAASNNGVPPNLFRSLIRSESGFDPGAKNPSGASGIAQFMPGTAKDMGIDPFDVPAALNASAKYLADHFKKYGNWKDAIAQYKGYGNDLLKGYDKAGAVLGDAGLEVPATIPTPTSPNIDPDKSFFSYSLEDWKEFFKTKTLALVLVVVGLLFIFLSVYSIFKKGN